MRILLVEDDEILADRLVVSLVDQQYAVDAIADGQEGLEYAQAAPYDLIIADVGLPNLDGITLCKRLREQGCSTPMLLMTAKNAPDERIRGLDAGADDHLTKPLNLDELHARVRALLRRGEVTPDATLWAGQLRLDPVSCQVTFGDTPLKVTPKEYSLLALFLRSPNRVFSRAHIIEHLWSFDDPPLEDSVKAHIKGLRRKLKQVGAVNWIENVYGIGYRFAPEVSAAASSPLAADGQPATASPVETDGTPDTIEAFRGSMAGLWHKYHGLMAQRIDALTAAAAAIEADQLTPALQENAVQAAHKLAGVLGMFEQDQGTTLAREIETLLAAGEASGLAGLPAHIDQLAALIQGQPPSTAGTAESGYWLLVSPQAALLAALETVSQPGPVPWRQAQSPEEASALVQTAAPALVVVDIATAALWTPCLDFVRQLLAQHPSTPTIALATTDSLLDRVAIAQAGVQQLVQKPVGPAQLWNIAHRLHQKRQRITAQILAVDDDPLILKALRYLLEPWGLGVTALENPNQFWDVLNRTRPDLLILDVEMPDFTGIELCQAVRTDPTWQNLPILFLSSHRDAATVEQIFQVGADDYASKPIVGPELLTRILHRLERNRLLKTLSCQDAITGLANQVYSQQALEQLLAETLAAGGSFSLGVIRLTELPAINRCHGHRAGQKVLQHWGQCFQTLLSDATTVGYWGMGEFVVGLPGMPVAAAQEVLAPLLQALRRQIITLANGERVQPTSEWAIAAAPAAGKTLPSLYQAAYSKL